MKVDVLGHAKVLMTPGRVLRALKTQIDTRSATSHHGALELLTGVNINDWLLGMVWGALPPQFASYLKLTIAVLVTGVGPWLAGGPLAVGLQALKRGLVHAAEQMEHEKRI
jgi:hypothetical protein